MNRFLFAVLAISAQAIIAAKAQSASASIGLLDAGETSNELFAAENKFDLSVPQDSVYGYSSERHGANAQTRVFTLPTASTVAPISYGCEFTSIKGAKNQQPDEQTNCWKQTSAAPYAFTASPVRVSLDDMQKAATEVARIMRRGKVAQKAEFTLLKVWPEASGIQVQLGYEVQAIEETYVCSTSPKLTCSPAMTYPKFEP